MAEPRPILTLATVTCLSFAGAWVITWLARHISLRFRLLDVPNERSSHDMPTPRGGGIAIISGSVLPLVALTSLTPPWTVAIVAMLVVAAIGFMDDVFRVSVALRLAVHATAAAAAMSLAGFVVHRVHFPGAGAVELGVLAFPLTAFFVVGLTNAYNFMDGINGLASLEAMVAGAAAGCLLLRQADYSGAAVGFAIAAGAAGFLPWNFPRASIFMGDVGSGALGFILALLAVRYAAAGGSIVAVVLPLMPFIVDTSVTLVRRALRRERLYAAHRTHFYQRLNRLGWSHALISVLWTSAAVAGAVVAWHYERMSPMAQVTSVAVLLLSFCAIGVWITVAERRRESAYRPPAA